MTRGGARPGGGRPKGSKSRQRAEIESRLAELGCDPIAGLVAIAEDEKAPLDVKARVLIELAGYCYAKQRPEVRPRQLPIDSTLTLDQQARQVVHGWSVGTVSLEDGRSALQGLAYAGEIRRDTVLAALVADLYRRQGRADELPADLRQLTITGTAP